MLKINANIRLSGGLLIAGLVIFVSSTLVGAQTPTPQESPAPTPEVTPESGSEAASPINHSIIGYEDCLQCHTEGEAKAQIMPSDHTEYANAGCQECHKPAVLQVVPAWEELPPGAAPAPLVHPPAEGQEACFECHLELGDEHTDISEAWQESVHGQAEIGCSDCHGGDPTTDEMSLSMAAEAGYIGVPLRGIIPQMCGGCHSDVERMGQYNLSTDQYSKYVQSVHGTKLQEGDIRVAICTDCHGTHDIKKGSDTTAAIYPLNVPAMCAECHSDPELMEPYDLRTDQHDLYAGSIHGQLLLEEQDVRAPTCTSCHGSHNTSPPTAEEVINVCGECHTATEELYQESLHARIEENAPKCWTCHGTHDVFKTDESMFLHNEPLEEQHCGTCHLDNKSFRMEKTRFELIEDRRCDTCHHEGSRIMRQILGLHTALTEANHAYEEAEEAIAKAGMVGMIVTEAELKLAEARTSLVSGRAAVHTTKLPLVTEFTDDAMVSANKAYEIAAGKLSENLFRRLSMVVAVMIILIIIVTLIIFKRDLDRQLKLAYADLGEQSEVPQMEPEERPPAVVLDTD